MISFRKLRWDEWNIAHIARHNVTPDEVEEVCHGDPVIQTGKKGRKLVLGPTKANRIVLAVLDPEGKGKYYPVTARDASKKERKLYKQEKEVEENDKKQNS